MKSFSTVRIVSVVGLTSWAFSCWATASGHDAPGILKEPVAAVVDTSSFMVKYQKAVQQVVNVQTGSWIRHAGLIHRDYYHLDRHDQEQEEEEIEDQQNNYYDFPDDYAGVAPPMVSPHRAPLSSPRVLEVRTGFESLAAPVFPEEVNVSSRKHDNPAPAPPALVWDNESDVPKYFEELLKACSETIGDLESLGHFHEACFGTLRGLMKEPRCTTSLDSRTECNSQMMSNEQGLSSSRTITAQSILGEPHFTEDTLNVVILGAGPVGLFLASALMEIQKRGGTDAAAPPEIRVVVFENRVVAPGSGRKTMYSRDWMTDISRDYMEGTLSSKLLQLLDVLFKTEGYSNAKVSLPINALETLLLLSNRAAGVKFIYDDYNN
jgi:hypothetical protein